MVKAIVSINHGNYCFLINNLFKLRLMFKLLIKNIVFIKKASCKLKNVKIIDFY